MKSSDIVAYAMGGPMNITGHADYEPLKLAGNIVAMHAGSVAAYATMVALWDAEDTDEGQHVDVSIYETQAGFRDRRVIYLTAYAYTGRAGVGRRAGVGIVAGKTLVRRLCLTCVGGLVARAEVTLIVLSSTVC